jgi:hypothetical protein
MLSMPCVAAGSAWHIAGNSSALSQNIRWCSVLLAFT